MKIDAIVQARMGSTRLPGKVLKKLNGITLLDSLIQQLKHSKLLNRIIIATSTNSEDDEIINFLEQSSIDVFRGSSLDVLDRYYQCATKFNCKHIVRITADNPLIDPNIVDETLQELTKFFYHIATALGAKKICEVGCNVGNNLFGFPKDFQVYGIDRNEYALEKAKVNHPSFKFEKMPINKIDFPDSFFDLVFTRGVLIHIPSDELDECLKQILRISKKWIFHLEYFGNDGEMISWSRGDDLLWYRNMKDRWSKFNVEIVSDTDISENLDFGKMRFTLVKKK